MASPVVGVHGIGNYGYQRKAGGDLPAAVQAIGADWQGWLSQGLGNFDLTVPVPSRLPVAYYADCLFRGLGMGITEPENLTPLGQRLLSPGSRNCATVTSSRCRSARGR